MGEIGILNVGAGDTKLSFDKNNPQECIRAARIVTDMLRRGYALLIEIDDGAGGKSFVRAKDFDPNTCEYIIADFDPVTAAAADAEESREQEGSEVSAATGEAATKSNRRSRKGITTRRVDASRTTGVAVPRTAGG